MSSPRNYHGNSALPLEDLFPDFATEVDETSPMYTFPDHVALGESDKTKTPPASMTTSFLDIPSTLFLQTQPIDDLNDALLCEATNENVSDTFGNTEIALQEHAYVTHPTQVTLENTFFSEKSKQDELEESAASEMQSSKKIKTENTITTVFDASILTELSYTETDREVKKTKQQHQYKYLPVEGIHLIPQRYRSSISLYNKGCYTEHRFTMLNKWGEQITIEAVAQSYLYRKRLILKNTGDILTKAQLGYLRMDEMGQLTIEQNGVTEAVVPKQSLGTRAKLEKNSVTSLDEDQEAPEGKKRESSKSSQHIYLPVDGKMVVPKHFETKIEKRGKIEHTYALIPDHPQTGFRVPLSTITSLPNAKLVVKKTGAFITYEQLCDLTRGHDGELYITIDGKIEHVLTRGTHRRNSKKIAEDLEAISSASSDDDKVLTTQVTQGEIQTVLTRSSSFSPTLFASPPKTGVNQTVEKQQKPKSSSEDKQKFKLKRKP